MLISVIDVGTSKAVALIAEVKEDGGIAIKAFSTRPSLGFRQGVVVDIEEATKSFDRVVQEAELVANVKIESVYVSISGSHIRSLNSQGIAPIPSGEVNQNDVDRALETAQTVKIADNQVILHALPVSYTIDGMDGIQSPLGLSGHRLLAKVHLVTGNTAQVENIVRCVNKCGLEVADLVVHSIASGLATLMPDERELGALLIDIGGGTTDFSVFQRGAISMSAVIPVAGDHITNDIALMLKVSRLQAEEIKRKRGVALVSQVPEDEMLDLVPSLVKGTTQKHSLRYLANIIEQRYIEIFRLIEEEIKAENTNISTGFGVVLAGGGTRIRGLPELAEEYFHLPTRIGCSDHITEYSKISKDPVYSASVGLLVHAMQDVSRNKPSKESLSPGIWKYVLKCKKWLSEDL